MGPSSVATHDWIGSLTPLHATVYEEFELGLNSVAVPVRDHLGTVVASISVSGPAFRFTEQTVAGLVEDLKEAGERVSRGMGHTSAGGTE